MYNLDSKRGWLWTSLITLILVSSHTQLTLKHIGLRLCKLQYGEVHGIFTPLEYLEHILPNPEILQIPQDGNSNYTILWDRYGVFLTGKLKDKKIRIGIQEWTILDNTVQYLLISGDPTQFREARLIGKKYICGFEKWNWVYEWLWKFPFLNLGIAHILLGIGGIIMFLAFCQYPSTFKKAVAQLPSPGWIFIGVAIASLLPWGRLGEWQHYSPNWQNGMKELFQYGCFFFFIIMVNWVMQHLNPKTLSIWFSSLVWCSGIVICLGWLEYIAVFQHWTLSGLLDVQSIDSTFGIQFNPDRAWATGSESTRNVLGIYLGMILPFLFFYTWFYPSKGITQWVARIGWVTGWGLILHLWILLITGTICFFLVSWQRVPQKESFLPDQKQMRISIFRENSMLWFYLPILFLIGLCWINPEHGKLLAHSVAYRISYDRYGLIPLPWKGGQFQGDEAWQQKYAERQASINSLTYSPFLGYGLGNYQQVINQFFEQGFTPELSLEKSPKNLMERGSHGLFWVLLVEVGIIGTLVYLIFILTFWIQGWQSPNGIHVSGSVIFLFISCWVGNFMVRGLDLLAAFFLALTFSYGTGFSLKKEEDPF